MIHQRSREIVSVFTGVAVLAMSLLSGCFGCLPRAAAQMAHGTDHACCKQAVTQNCHVPTKKAPAGSDCTTGKIDLGSTEHFWSKVVSLDHWDVIHSGFVLVAAVAPLESPSISGPPSAASPPDRLSLNSSFRI